MGNSPFTPSFPTSKVRIPSIPLLLVRAIDPRDSSFLTNHYSECDPIVSLRAASRNDTHKTLLLRTTVPCLPAIDSSIRIHIYAQYLLLIEKPCFGRAKGGIHTGHGTE